MRAEVILILKRINCNRFGKWLQQQDLGTSQFSLFLLISLAVVTGSRGVF